MGALCLSLCARRLGRLPNPQAGRAVWIAAGWPYITSHVQAPDKRSSAAPLYEWRVIRLKGTPAAEIGRVQAHDADEAVKIAIEQYEVAPAFLEIPQRSSPDLTLG